MKVFMIGLFLLMLSPPVPNGSIMAVFGNKGNAHACPVNGTILTAEHVTKAGTRGLHWSDQYGSEGTLTFMPPDDPRDIVVLRVDKGDTPVYNELGPRPKKDDKIYWYHYNGDMADDRIETKVVNTRGGHIFAKKAPEHGASGGCVYDEQNRVVGIVVWGMHVRASVVAGIVDVTRYFPE
jgi:hypothetical protein